MRERSLENTSDCPSTSSCLKHSHPATKVAKKEFWIARRREVPKFACNPWDFYEKLLEFNSNHFLVLCNDGKNIRIMRIFNRASQGTMCFPLLEIQHPNFADICEAFLFEDAIFAVVEYVGFSVEDLLQHSIYPTEREIAYIVSQVSLKTTAYQSSYMDIADFSRHAICLVQETRSSTCVNTEHYHISERRGQDW